MQFAQLDFDVASVKLQKLLATAAQSLNINYVIIDTQAGPGSLNFVASTLSDVNLILLEEDDISWRTALNLLLEISDLNKRLQRRSRSYFLANKASVELVDTAGKLKAFSFLSPLPYDAWMQKLFAKATSTVLEKEFENTDFFRQVRVRLWPDIAALFGMTKQPMKDGFTLSSLFRKQNGKTSHRPVIEPNGAAAVSADGMMDKVATGDTAKGATEDKTPEKIEKGTTPQGYTQSTPQPQKSSGNAREGRR